MKLRVLERQIQQSEIGPLPADWSVETISALARVTTGSRNTQDRISDGLYPFFVRSQTIERINSYCFEGEAILTAGDGVGTGKVFHYITGRFDVHQRVYLISDFSQRVHGRFLFEYFRSHFFSRVMSMTAKSSVDSVRREMITDMLVPVPPLAEQRAIATALSDMDALIAAQEKLIAKKRDIKTATMQQLLTGRKRLRGYEGPWKRRQPLGKLVDLLTGFPFSSASYSRVGFKLMRGANIKRGSTDWSEANTQYWGELTSSLKKYQLKSGDIVVAMDGSLVGRSFAQLRSSDLPALLLQRVARIRADALDQNFVKHWVCGPLFTDHCDKLKTVTAIPHICPGDIMSFSLDFPVCREEQKAIAEVLSDMDAEITALEARLAKLRDIKQGMMQELLTGRTRLV